MGHLFRDILSLHCFTFMTSFCIPIVHYFSKTGSYCLFPICLGVKSGGLLHLCHSCRKRACGENPQPLHGLLIFGLLLWHLEKNLVLYKYIVEVRSGQDRQMFSFFNFYDSINYSWYKVLINSAFDFRETISKSIVHSAKSHCYYKVFEVTLSHQNINNLFLY